MGNLKNVGKFTAEMIKEIPGGLDKKAGRAGIKAGIAAKKHGMSSEAVNMVSNGVYKGMKYGAYGAAGVGVVGAAVGVVDDDTSFIGGTLGGVGLGAVGGAGAGAVAAAIAKGVR
jgi:hypothetical protein